MQEFCIFNFCNLHASIEPRLPFFDFCFPQAALCRALPRACVQSAWLSCLHFGLNSHWLSVQLPWMHLIAPRMWMLFPCVPIRETSVVTFFLPPNFMFTALSLTIFFFVACFQQKWWADFLLKPLISNRLPVHPYIFHHRFHLSYYFGSYRCWKQAYNLESKPRHSKHWIQLENETYLRFLINNYFKC